MQRAYISKLLELAEKDKNIIHLLADSGTGFDEMFRKLFPDRMYNFGIAENAMVAAASGLAMSGKIPFVYTAGAFLAYRSFEFIRDDVCFQNANVKIVGMGSGLAWSSLGPTHHTTEDVAVLRSLPNLMILSPATPRQVAACVEEAYRHRCPVYIRIGMNNEKEFFEEGYTLSLGKNDILVDGNEYTLFSTGSILEEAYDAVAILKQKGIRVKLVNVHTLKPFDRASIINMAKEAKAFFTVEEHSIYGGLGGIISEIIAEEGLRIPVRRLGLFNGFASGYGTQKSVRMDNGLDAVSIARYIEANTL